MSYLEHIWKNLQVAGYCILLCVCHIVHAFYFFKGGHRLLYFLEAKTTGIKRGMK